MGGMTDLDPRARHRARPPGGRRARRALRADGTLAGEGVTDDDGRIRELADGPSRARTASSSIRRRRSSARRARGRARRRPPPRPAADLVVRVRELPRQLSAEQLAELFEGRTRFVEQLAALDDPLGRAREVARDAVRRGEEGGARRAPGDRREADLGALAAEQGPTTIPGARRARRAERRLRGEVRLPLRRLREPAGRGARSSRSCASGSSGRARRSFATGVDELVQIAIDRWRTLVALSDYWWGWGNLLFRWLHVIAAMAWIGASFYFIALDNHLEPPRDPARRASAASAARRGRCTAAASTASRSSASRRERLPEPLHWFKWEAYTTWLSGFALFIVVYYSHATSYLIDPTVADLTAWEAIAISVGGLVLAWLVYDGLCRAFANDEGVLAVLVFAFICLVRVGRVGALRAARRVPAGRRDDRDDDGRQRLLRDHPGALGARPREGGGARARPALEPRRQDALGAQQLPDAAGRVRDALEPLPVHVRARATAGSCSSR